MTAPLERLRQSSVPTLANALELFGAWPANRGYTTQPLTSHLPSAGMVVGYASTAVVSTDQPAGIAPHPVSEGDYWRYIESVPEPRVAVIRDLDEPSGGAMWGEWNTNVHRALGCVGAIVHGAVRDLDAIIRLGFPLFSTSVSVSHGYGAFVEFGGAVSIAGLTIRSGDLLVADRHGVLRLPASVPIDELIEVAEQIDQLEQEVFLYCQGPDFTVAGLEALNESVAARWPRPRDQTEPGRAR